MTHFGNGDKMNRGRAMGAVKQITKCQNCDKNMHQTQYFLHVV